MRKFHGDDTAGAEQDLHAPDEIVDVRNVRENVVAEQQVRPEHPAAISPRAVAAEERQWYGYPFDRNLGDVRGGLDAQAGMHLATKCWSR